MCTPDNVRELALGFVVSEGIASPESVKISDAPCLKDGRVVVVEVPSNFCQPEIRSSGCIGVYRETEVVPKVKARELFSLDEVRSALQYLEVDEYHRTRGYHIAALVGKEGLILRRYDVGRHNAVDKVIGAALMREIDFSRTYLVISGRISRGIAMKCARVGIPLIVSKAAILDSAVDVCRRSGLAAVSFATNVAVVGDALEI